MKALELTEVDRRIWQEELAAFVPPRVFDVHTHAYRWAFNTDPAKEGGPDSTLNPGCPYSSCCVDFS